MPHARHAALLALIALPGLTTSNAIAETTAHTAAAADIDVRTRLNDARDLVRHGHYEAATDELVWLWDNMVKYEPALRGVRVSFMAADMQEVAQAHPPARAAFEALRDRAALNIDDRHHNNPHRADWLVLNIRVLNDDAAVARWIDDPGTEQKTLERHRHIILDWLTEHGRWETAGMIMPSARAVVERRRDTYQRIKQMDGNDPQLNGIMIRQHQDELAQAHAAYLAAGRPESAWFAADALIEDVPGEDSIRILCETAIQAGVVDHRHIQLALGNDHLTRRLREVMSRPQN